MMKEIVIRVEDGRAYQVDVNASIRKVERFSLNHPMNELRIVTYQPDLLVNLLGQNVGRVEILSFECLDKQIRQSIGLEEPKGQWNVPNMLSAYLGIAEKDWQYEEQDEVLKLLADCYLIMKDKGVDEWKRITEIEIPVNKILYRAQLNGLYFNHEGIESLCQELHQSIYDYKNIIQLELGYTDDALEPYLRLKGIKHNPLNDHEIKRLCKLYPNLEPFRKLRNAQRNFNCLIMLDAMRKDTNICKPLFKGFGTTTGRIILKDPAIQNLSKRFRGLLKDDALPYGYRYVYVDFGQFEAGILAGLSGNKKLQDIYEKDTLYERLLAMSKSADRDAAKTAFYCFVYGGIVSKGTESFFTTYGLQEIVDRVEKNALANGFVTTLLGNRRVVKSEADKNWIMNHYIQGMSSLIFKQALIDVNNLYRDNVRLILPMHDAALYIVNSNISTESIINTFKEAFRKWIKGSKPVVKEKDFFSGE